MSTLRYSLKTASPRIEVDGVMVETHLLSYSRTLSPVTSADPYTLKVRRAEEASDERLRKLWSKRPTPQFVVFGRYGENSEVYGDWKRGACFWTEGDVMPGRFLGVLVRKGRMFALQRWHTVLIPELDGDKAQQMQEMARGRWMTQWDGSRTLLHAENELDLVTAKLIAC